MNTSQFKKESYTFAILLQYMGLASCRTNPVDGAYITFHYHSTVHVKITTFRAEECFYKNTFAFPKCLNNLPNKS